MNSSEISSDRLYKNLTIYALYLNLKSLTQIVYYVQNNAEYISNPTGLIVYHF